MAQMRDIVIDGMTEEDEETTQTPVAPIQPQAPVAEVPDAQASVIPEDAPVGDQGPRIRHTEFSREEDDLLEEQRGVWGDVKAGFQQTAISAAVRRATTELSAGEQNDRSILESVGIVASALIGRRQPDGTVWDKREGVDELLKGIPRASWGAIMSEPDLAAAGRARAELLDDMDKARVNAAQFDGGAAQMASTMGDADLPLMFLTGGMAFGAKTARTAQLASRSKRLQGAIQGTVAGAQAGAVVGGVDYLTREQSEESAFIISVLGGAVMGNVLGALTGPTIAKMDADLGKRWGDGDNMSRTDTTYLTVSGANEQVLTEVEMNDLFSQPAGDMSVGAGHVGNGVETLDKLDLPEHLSPEQKQLIEDRHSHNYEAGVYDRRAEQTGWLDKIGNSAWNWTTGTGFSSRMHMSDSKVANWMSANIFESANGSARGVSTAASLMEKYHRMGATQLLPVKDAMYAWAQKTDNGMWGTSHGISSEGHARFNREVMLERNARQFGRTKTKDQHISNAADAYDSAARDMSDIATGRKGEHAVRGMETKRENVNYTPQLWSGAKIMSYIKDGNVTRDNMVESLTIGYRNAGMALGKDAKAVANAVLARAEARSTDVDMSVHSLLQADGREFLRTTLMDAGNDAVEVDAIINRLVGDQKDRSKLGSAKSRNEIDTSVTIKTADGEELLLVDLLSHDLDTDWQRYIRGMSGSAALARHGIRDATERTEIINAIRAEQIHLGEEVTAREELVSMFTHFDAGPVKGWSKHIGGEPQAAGSGVASAKRMVQLAWLNKLGLTQLGETGAMMAQNSIATWVRRGPIANLNKELKAGNQALLDDMAFLVGEIGQDHHLFQPHKMLDEVTVGDAPDWISKLNGITAKASYIQGFTSLFNHVRASQQKTAALGVMDKVFREIKSGMDRGEGLTDVQKARMWSDLGIGPEQINQLENLVERGVIEFAPEGHVNRLNADQWDGQLQDDIGTSVIRNINQVVQKSMAGEQDAWMHTGLGSILTHLKTFPMAATQKQFIRHFRHNDAQAWSALAMGFGTAAAASVVRAALDGKSGEMSAADHGKRAFGYSNMTGFIPMGFDPLATMLGLDDMRFNQYGRHAEIAPPILSWGNDAMRLPGALVKTLGGQADYDDERAKRTLPFANMLLIGEMLTSIGGKD